MSLALVTSLNVEGMEIVTHFKFRRRLIMS